MSTLLRTRAGALALVMLALLAGVRSLPGATTPNVDAEIAQASQLQRPLLVLVAESGMSKADNQALKAFNAVAVKGNHDRIWPVLLDLSISRNRAEAARFHATNTPVLLSLTPRGLIMTRDESLVTKELVRNRMEGAAPRARELDAKFAALEQVAQDGKDFAARLELGDFLFRQQNAREAIPILSSVAHSDSADPGQRVRAWVELVRAHFWILEPEKGRHEANDLLAVLGPTTPLARAGGNLVLGVQDANAKRTALARRELAAAIAAAPGSEYATQAAGALAKLPGEGK